MKKIKVSFEIWVQLLGMIGVLGGLVFVGLEMQQSQRIAMAGQQMERTAIMTQQFSAFTESGLDWHSNVIENRPQLSDQYSPSLAAGRNNFHQGLFIFENDYFQYSQGLMPEEVWQSKLAALAFFKNQCNLRDIWESRKRFFPEGLITLLDSLPDECGK